MTARQLIKRLHKLGEAALNLKVMYHDEYITVPISEVKLTTDIDSNGDKYTYIEYY